MQKIVLTSTGLSNTKIQKAFIKLIDKTDNKSVVIITTAAKEKEKNKYSKLAKRQFKEMGFNKVDFIDVECENPKKLKNYDIIYVCGGNTFYLLNYIKKSGAGKIIKKLIKQGVIYIGVSAGSIIPGPSIKNASEIGSDINKIGITEFNGLNIIPWIIVPHYTTSLENQVKKFEKKYNIRVICLTDNQAIIVQDGKQAKI